MFMPFKVQEIMDKGGIYFGENAISHNLIMCNKENLLNQSAFLLGVPGSGKSFSAKELMTFLMLNTEDDILVCDPEGEYESLENIPLIAAPADAFLSEVDFPRLPAYSGDESQQDREEKRQPRADPAKQVHHLIRGHYPEHGFQPHAQRCKPQSNHQAVDKAFHR